MKHIQMELPDFPGATLEGFLLTGALKLGQDMMRPSVIVCPGGGYVYCSNAEGEPVAMAYANRGFHAFILRYTTGQKAAGFAPLKQLSWVIGYLRQHSEEWNIHPDKIAVCGFSAGGHLALASGVMGENRPNAMVLGYPAASAPNMPGMDFMLRFLTGKDAVNDADAAEYELVSKICADTPPAFLMATAEDPLTPFGALAVANRYSQLGKRYELHIFQFGPHGYSLARETSADGSSRYLDPAFESWHDLSVRWLNRTFGEPVFVDKSNSKMAGYLKEMGIQLPGF